jgi:hypothetical protein
MRSSPLLLLLLVVLGFGALAVPLAWLTQAEPETPAAASPQPAGDQVNTLVRFRFAHPPLEVSLKQGTRVVTTLARPVENPVELTAPLALANDGVELVMESSWPPGTPWTALTVELEPDGLEARSITRWTDSAALAEVIAFSWP